MKNTTVVSAMPEHIRKLVFTAVFAALIFAATAVFPFPLAGGYANLGDAVILCSAFFLGPLWGFLAGSIGSALSDLFLGFAVYAPATFIIKGLIAVIFALLCRRQLDHTSSIFLRLAHIILAALPAEGAMIAGYFLFECVLYGVPTASADVIGNLIQGAVGIAVAVFAICAISSNKAFIKLTGSGK